MGLTSRAAVVPLNLAADIAGPMARTVEDVATVLQVVEGYDPSDAVPASSRDHNHPPYAKALVADGLAGARIGILRMITDSETADPEVLAVFESSLAALTKEDAIVIDPFAIKGLDEVLEMHREGCSQFKFDLNAYLARHGDRAPFRTLAEIIESRAFHPSTRPRLEAAQTAELPPEENPACQARDEFRERFRNLVLDAMNAERVDALAGSVATFGITRKSPLGGPRDTANPNTLWIRHV